MLIFSTRTKLDINLLISKTLRNIFAKIQRNNCPFFVKTQRNKWAFFRENTEESAKIKWGKLR
jgi:hypothetical protein